MLSSALFELSGLLTQAGGERRLVVEFHLRGVITDLLRDLYRAEVGRLRPLLREGLVVELARRRRLEREVELIPRPCDP
jgi:hypothetical protein